MIGIDTNVLARALLNDDATWTPVARRFLAEHLTEDAPGFVNLLTLAELVWTLNRNPAFDKTRIAEVVEGLLGARNLVVERSEMVARALTRFKAGRPGFVDCLIVEINLDAGADPTVTIDKPASKTSNFIPLPRG